MSNQTTLDEPVADAEKQAAHDWWQAWLQLPETKALLERDLFGTLRTGAYLLRSSTRQPRTPSRTSS